MATPESPLDAAARRLNEALARLEQRLAQRVPANDADAELFADRGSELAAALEQERVRVRELEAAAADASAALGRAAAEIRAAVGETAGDLFQEEA